MVLTKTLLGTLVNKLPNVLHHINNMNIVLENSFTVSLTCLSLCNTQARAVNLIHAVLCDDEGVTQARGC